MASSLQFQGLLLILASCSAVLGLKIDSPIEGDSWNLSMPSTISWSSVSSDPANFDIVLVNNNPSTYSTGYSTTVQKNVSTSAGSVSLAANDIQGGKVGSGFQLNLVGSGSNSGILAQSPQFNITGVATGSANTTSSNSTKPTQSSNTTSGSVSSNSKSSASTNAKSPAGRVQTPYLKLTIGGLAALTVSLVG